MPATDKVKARVVGRGYEGFAITVAPDGNTEPHELLVDAWFAPLNATFFDATGAEKPLADVADGDVVTMSPDWLSQ